MPRRRPAATPGRSLDIVTQVETHRAVRRAARRRLRAATPRARRCSRPPSGSPTVEKEPARAAVPAARRRAAGARRRASTTPRLVLDAFLLRSLAVAGLRAVASTTAPGAARPARTGASRSPAGGVGLRGLPAARVGDARAASTRRPAGALLSGDWARRRRQRAAAPPRGQRARRRVPAVAPGARAALAAAVERDLRRGRRATVSRRPTRLRRAAAAPVRGPAAADRRPASWCRGTSPWSWTATAAGPSSAGCPGPRATRRARRRCSTSSRARSRSASVALRLRLLHRELEALARRGALPHGLQPRRHPPAPRRDARDGRPGPLGRPAAAAVEAA